MQLAPGTYAVTNEGAAAIEAFGEWLDLNAGSVRLFEKEGGDAMLFTPGAEPSEFAAFQVYQPVEWTLAATPVPAKLLDQAARPDAVPGEPGSPRKGKPEGLVPGFGGDLLTLDQLVWLVLLGLYFYSNSKGNRR